MVRCQAGKEATFIERARVGLRFYQEQTGCRGVHLLRSRSDENQLLALSLWDREVDLMAAREQPGYQQAMVAVAETYAEPQAVSEWDIVEL
jgi:heme-degrading monooxygenase HmoA